MLGIEQLISLSLTKADIVGLSSDLVPLGDEDTYGELLDDDARAFMDFYKHGYRVYPYRRLLELDYKQKSTVVGVVHSNPRLGEYTRKSGEPGRFLAIPLTDPSGGIDVLVWSDHEIEDIQKQNIAQDDVLLVVGVKLNKGKQGDHLGLAQSFVVKVNPPGILREVLFHKEEYDFLALDQVENNVGRVVDVKGVLVEKGRLITFERKDGTGGLVLHLKIFDPFATAPVTLWDSAAETAAKMMVSEEVVFRNLRVKQEDGAAVLHSVGNTVIGN